MELNIISIILGLVALVVGTILGKVIFAKNTQKTIAEIKKELPLTSDLLKVIPSASLLKKLTILNKGEIPDGTLYIIDPMGNIMMQYPPGFDSYKVIKDLMQLLKASQIG
jgi:uncharacterized protein YneF (UPF0154 family)